LHAVAGDECVGELEAGVDPTGHAAIQALPERLERLDVAEAG
jgi:hypothetical protein